ncbi:MAG: polymer-forming cytoskeletal protein [Bdellovibrionales bacterium]|nr:polymer-forming cytoskeletal protein [Bdellovibrionales bacterium]
MNWWRKEDEENEKSATKSNSEAGQSPLSASSGTAHSASTSASPRSTASSAPDLEKKYGTVRSALSSGTVIQGKLSFDTPVRIDGSLMGEIFSSSVLIVGPSGSVSADINVETLVVLGTVSGEIKARKKIELHASGELVGNIETPNLFIEEGAYFDGACAMTSKAAEKVKEKVSVESSSVAKESSVKSGTISAKIPIVTAKKDDSLNAKDSGLSTPDKGSEKKSPSVEVKAPVQ